MFDGQLIDPFFIEAASVFLIAFGTLALFGMMAGCRLVYFVPRPARVSSLDASVSSKFDGVEPK